MRQPGAGERHPNVPDDAIEELCRRLRASETVLRSVIRRLAAAEAALGTPELDGWHGPARVAYGLARHQLQVNLAAAGTHLDTALQETMRALDALEAMEALNARRALDAGTARDDRVG